ncbi:DctP family TRAP transporter solute-binding subunit [Motiliproteus sp. SC1-56]|uniref:TRAP transporter substrate-binding protein n=1 Tax=Motiliproteus sp. SC1-56 TaxID=2799565 RepID=UPI001A8C724F|nr:DctP family TRAP transporter solute-binding subunit [Motiliproteus sp. SC1-56]
MKLMKKIVSASMTLGLAAGLLAAPMAHAEKVLKLHHLNNNDPFDNPTGAMASVFKSLVESGTNGEVKVQLFPNSQLGKDAEVVQQVKAGVVQSGIHSVGGFASAYPLIGVLDVPFAYPNISATYKVFDGPFGKRLAGDIEDKTGIKVLGFGDSGGFFAITNSKREVRSPADMKGLKIRTMGLDTHKAVIESIGGQPAAIAWSEVYTALQTGVADGQMNPVPIISFAKFNEVQKHLTLTGHLFTPYVWSINADFYDGLSESEKSVVEYAARSAIVAGRGMARAIEASERGLPSLEKSMKVYSPTPAEREAFREAAQPVVKKVIAEKYGEEGEALMNAFLEAVES